MIFFVYFRPRLASLSEVKTNTWGEHYMYLYFMVTYGLSIEATNTIWRTYVYTVIADILAMGNLGLLGLMVLPPSSLRIFL
jgi:hypothetical protein